jgi:hypothetical protein
MAAWCKEKKIMLSTTYIFIWSVVHAKYISGAMERKKNAECEKRFTWWNGMGRGVTYDGI